MKDKRKRETIAQAAPLYTPFPLDIRESENAHHYVARARGETVPPSEEVRIHAVETSVHAVDARKMAIDHLALGMHAQNIVVNRIQALLLHTTCIIVAPLAS